ncbi:MAG TPA: hypothetical protein VGQ83_01195 [Polyangia bacterium]|jgi:hypothetical protein
MSVGRDDIMVLPPEPGVAHALAGRMPLVLLAVAAALLLQWWVLASGSRQGGQPAPPPAPAQGDGAAQRSQSACDCGGCDCGGCDAADCGSVCELGDACSGCDVGGCDCIAVPPVGVLGGGGDAHSSCSPRTRKLVQVTSLGLLVPLIVLGWWRRRR